MPRPTSTAVRALEPAPSLPVQPRTAATLLARTLLVASGAIHLYFGAAFAISPEPWMESLSIAGTSPVGVIEMRAFYGGLMLGLGALFLAAAIVRGGLLPGTIGMTVTYLAAACVRTAGMLAARELDGVLVFILSVEVSGAVLGAVAWWRMSIVGDLRV